MMVSQLDMDTCDDARWLKARGVNLNDLDEVEVALVQRRFDYDGKLHPLVSDERNVRRDVMAAMTATYIAHVSPVYQGVSPVVPSENSVRHLICAGRENWGIIQCDACHPACVCNIRLRSAQVEAPASS